MIDKHRDPSRKGTLPAFTPVPRQHNRHDGWTPERQHGFVEALADLGSVRAAANAVNMTPESAYQLRRHAEAGPFRKAWDAALQCGVQRLEDVAMERALHGVEVPVYHFGVVVGTRRHYNDALLMFILRNRAPKRFAADSWQTGDAVTTTKLTRLRRQWQSEWDEEARQKNEANVAEVRASIERKVEGMRQRVLHRISQGSAKTRELHAAYLQSVQADEKARSQGLLPRLSYDLRREDTRDESKKQE